MVIRIEVAPVDDLVGGVWQPGGVRPTAGYPAGPDHTENGLLCKLLDVEKDAGITPMESFALWPAS